MKRLPHRARGRLRPAAPARPLSPRTRLTVEPLENRLAPSTTATPTAFLTWEQQRFTVDDSTVALAIAAQVGDVATAPTNNSFGALIGLNQVLANTTDRGQGYSVAVIDTGINYNDPNLAGRVVAGWNFVTSTSNYMDDNGHGTFVASEIASSSASYSGVAPKADLIALKVLDNTGAGTYANVLNALDWVVAHQQQYNIVAVNLSLGSGNYTVNPYMYLDSDFATLKNDGVLIAVAAGNDYYPYNSHPGLAYPAISSNVVSVGAVWTGNFGSVAWANGARDYTTAADQIASFSQRGSALSLLAPGAIITGDALHGGYTTMAGTSMAAPIVAGAAVLLHEALVDAGRSAEANQNFILHLMQSSGKTIVDTNKGADNVGHTGLTFHRVDLAAAFAALSGASAPPSNQPPILAAIPDQTVAAGKSLSVQLTASDPNGLPLSYSATVIGDNSQAYKLKTSLGLQYAGSYYTNLMGANEKWLYSSSGQWYCLLPDGSLRRWAGSWSATLGPTALIATLDVSNYTTPSLLWNAQPATSPATLTIANGVLTVKPTATFHGTFTVQVRVSDGVQSATTKFTVTVLAPGSLTLASIANQTVKAGTTLTLSLHGVDPTGHSLTYSAAIVSTIFLPYQLKTSLGLQYAGTYYANLMGANEKWLMGAGGTWYCLLTDGELRRWAGSWPATLQSAALVATLGATYYTHPSQLWNAPKTMSPATITVQGDQLIIQTTSKFRGQVVVQVTVSNGTQSVQTQFTVKIIA
jgi:subtilisin family serine protease